MRVLGTRRVGGDARTRHEAHVKNIHELLQMLEQASPNAKFNVRTLDDDGSRHFFRLECEANSSWSVTELELEDGSQAIKWSKTSQDVGSALGHLQGHVQSVAAV